MNWRYVATGIGCFAVGIAVGRWAGATNPLPTIQAVSQVGIPDAGVATARVTSTGGQEVASILCRVEPPPPPRQVVKTVYVKGDPVTVVCPEPLPCPSLLCEGTASTRQGSLSAQADSPLLPPATVVVQTRESPRKWGIGPALGVSSELQLHPGIGVAWQPSPTIEVHGNIVWTGAGKIPVGLTTDVLLRF